MRLILAHFAKNRNLDPLLPRTWSQITEADLNQNKVIYVAFIFFITFFRSFKWRKGGEKGVEKGGEKGGKRWRGR